MTQWGILLLCAYIALGATSRLTRRQAGLAAAALTVLVIGFAMAKYSSTTPTDKYIPATDAAVYATGRLQQPGSGTESTNENEAGVEAATWLSTDHAALTNGGGG